VCGIEHGKKKTGLPPASANFFLGVLFGPQDGDDIFSRNVAQAYNIEDRKR
jgi:hypothetical protein